MADETADDIIVMFSHFREISYVLILTFYQLIIVCLQSCTLLRHHRQKKL